jgi:hypothetical protein
MMFTVTFGPKRNAIIKQVMVRVGYTKGKKTSYSFTGALRSLFTKNSATKSSDEAPLLSGSSVFCSGLVVDWFNNAALDLDLPPPISSIGDAMSPQALKGVLNESENWESLGTFPK